MVPINLAIFAVLLSGAVLGAKFGLISMVVYVLLGAVGAPVFAGLASGLGYLFGKTGGYIIGYIACAWVVGFLINEWCKRFWSICLAMVIGVLVCYIIGTAWFMIVTKLSLGLSLTYCILPFLPGDAVKIVLAAGLYGRLKKLII